MTLPLTDAECHSIGHQCEAVCAECSSISRLRVDAGALAWQGAYALGAGVTG